ncbi:flagellar hook-length control protein FliK [Bacillus sp. FJAT-27245]|uniref:flagellar hook-length control protein FliK n=1 Tax=Bacillus sp. FJAT-27245 TaxID=1684144 RepID=UPI0006A79B67|nr:flagellar hook-length control protein FliK [Bacillus sp. FJAT-27245]
MIQPTMLGNVNKAAPGKGQGTESSTVTSFDLLLQMASGEANGEQKASEEPDGMEVQQNPFLLTNQLANLTEQEGPSPIQSETQGQDGIEPDHLRLRQKEDMAPQIGKQWNLSILHKLTNATGLNNNSPLMQELQKMLGEKVDEGLDGVQISDDSPITLGMKEGEQNPIILGDLPREAAHNSGNPLKSVLVPSSLHDSGGTGKETALTTPDTESALKLTDSETTFKPTDTKVAADADTKIPTNESRPAHPLQPVIAGDVPVLRANNFEQDIKQFFQSVLQPQPAMEGKEGMKPVVSFQRFVDGTEAIIKLSPEHLGDVEVKVKIQDGQVKAEFLASTHQGKDLLETQLHALRSALEVQGLQVGKIDITLQSSNSFMGAFSQRGDTNPRQGNQESRKRGEDKISAEENYHDYGFDTATHSQINTTA